MKLEGVYTANYFIASADPFDSIRAEDCFHTGGQPSCELGIKKLWTGDLVWCEVPNIAFEEFYTDFFRNKLYGETRKYGIWNKLQVIELFGDQIPDVTSEEWELDTAVWGTCGKSGEDPLMFIKIKNAETSHLQAILHTQPQIKGSRIDRCIKHVLDTRFKVTSQIRCELLEL